MISVSIVIPTLNRREFLTEAIQSCYEQSLAVENVIVVDNGSTDGTLSLDFGPGTQLVSEEKRGAGFARLRGLEEVRSTHVLFLDSDDLLVSNAIETLVSLARRDAPDIAYGSTNNFKTLDSRTVEGKQVLFPLSSASLIDLKAFRKFGSFEGHNFSFPEWTMKLQEAGANLAFTTSVVCMRRVHDSNMGRSQASRDFYLQLVRKRLANRTD